VGPPKGGTLRRIAPWVVSAGALLFVFGRTDWERLVEATQGANLPLFVLIATLDKAIFFLVWANLQAEAVRRFVVPVPRSSVIAVRGGSELFRTVSNPLADAAFLIGLARMTGGRVDAVVAAGLIPFVSHLIVLVSQATLALLVLPGGIGANRDVATVVAIAWTAFGVAFAVVRFAPLRRVPGLHRAFGWLEQVPLRRLTPFLGWFAALTAFDVLVQGAASRAFGIPLPWTALVARIPMLYLALTIPSVGNFGVREFVWGGLFEDYASRDALFAFAFSMNAVFLILNVLVGLLFFRRALDLLTEVRRSRRTGEPLPEPLLHDPIDP
jgi:hypothetical protein